MLCRLFSRSAAALTMGSGDSRTTLPDARFLMSLSISDIRSSGSDRTSSGMPPMTTASTIGPWKDSQMASSTSGARTTAEMMRVRSKGMDA